MLELSSLEIRLLGGFAVRLNEQSVTAFRSAKSRALLAYLATQPDQDHVRTTLATLFWGDLPDVAAKTNLRIELSNLKKLLFAHPALEISHHSVRFHSALSTTDVTKFSQTLGRVFALPVEAQGAHLPAVAGAVEIYRGEFLAGLELNDSNEFDDWRLSVQEQLHEWVMVALALLQKCYAEQGRWAELANAARRQLTLVPWTEAAHRALMQAFAAQGQIQSALEQFAKCVKVLQEELGVAPTLPTLELAERLREGRGAPSTTQHNLTPQLKSLVGRKEEITHVREGVQRARLVTLLGIGGVGKSHLAMTVAQSVLPAFADGVWVVPLANIEPSESAAERIALAVAATLNCPVTNLQTPLAELTRYLSTKQMLLVLDNCEHLLVAIEVLLHALLSQTAVHVLATSRTRLRVEGELPIPLEGLAAADAFQLFVERARRIVPSFGVVDKGEIARDVQRICQEVAGLPLGIELAASWVEHYSVAEIGQSLAKIAVEPAHAGELVSRHHTLGSVFAYSWRLLNALEQKVLARLSVFRGGFDRTAALTVAESGLSELSALIGHSLVQRVAAGRYDLHPLIQEFASAKLTEEVEGNEAAMLTSRHSHHYLGLLLATELTQRTTRLRIDFENVRSAWQQAVLAGDAELVQQAAPQFSVFVAQVGLMADGYALLQRAVDRFCLDAQSNELVAQLLDQQWIFARTRHGLRHASTLMHRILSLTTNVELQVRTHLNLAAGYAEDGEWEATDYHFDQVEALTQALSDPSTYIGAVRSRIGINGVHFRGDFAQGIARLEEMLALLNTSAIPLAEAEDLRARLHSSISLLAIRYGDYGLSIRIGQKNLARITELGHQQLRIWSLLDIALAEQFAGLYAEAIVHNQEALALAEAIGAEDDVGLLNANLCLTMRPCGQWQAGLAHGVKGAEILQALGLARQEGQARNRIGHTLLALGRVAEAYDAYGVALAVWARLQHPNRYEAVAGRAVAAWQLGKVAEAASLVDEVLAFVVAEGVMGIVEPALLLLNCEGVLTGLGRGEEAREALLLGKAWIERIASRISDDAVREVFVHHRPDNQRLQSRMAIVA